MIIQNIAKYLDFKGVSIRQAEIKAGITNGVISKAIKNNTQIGNSVVENFINSFPDINPEWLLTGKGSMLRATITFSHNDNNQDLEKENAFLKQQIEELKKDKQNLFELLKHKK